MFLVLHYVRSEVVKSRDIIGYVSSIYVTIMVCMNHSQIIRVISIMELGYVCCSVY